MPGAAETFVEAINDSGAFAGRFRNDTGYHGFISSGGVYLTIDVPGAAQTFVTDINASGALAGYFVQGSFGLRPFVYAGGVYTMLDNPASIDGDGIPLAINDGGDVVGYFTVAGFIRRGFLNSGGGFTSPGNPLSDETFAVDVNNSGVVIGYSTQPAEAFIYSAAPISSSATPPASASGSMQ